MPYNAQLIGIELPQDEKFSSIGINDFWHPERAVYILGNERTGITPGLLEACDTIVRLPGIWSINVAVAGSIVLYDRDKQFYDS